MEDSKLMEIKKRYSNKIPSLNEKDIATAKAFVNRYYKNIIENEIKERLICQCCKSKRVSHSNIIAVFCSIMQESAILFVILQTINTLYHRLRA